MKKISKHLLASAHLIGIFTEDIPIEFEISLIRQIWHKLYISFVSPSPSCCYVIKPQNSFFGTISVHTKHLNVGDSKTELTVGSRIDKILGADLSFEFKKYSEITELGQLEPKISKNDKRLAQILEIFNRRLLRHEFSHAKVAFLNVIHILIEQGLYEKPLKIDTLAEYDAFHYLIEEIQKSTEEAGELEDLIPNILDYTEIQEELGKIGLAVKLKELEVKTPVSKHFQTKLPVVMDENQENLLIITKTDLVAIANFIHKWKIDREWLERNKDLPVFDLKSELLNEFLKLCLVHFQIDKISKKIKSAKFHPESSLAEEVDKEKSVVFHGLPTKINLITISQFAGLADFRICMGGGLSEQNNKFAMGNTIYHATYEHIGAYIFTSKNKKEFAYAFYKDKRASKKIKKAVNFIRPGDSLEIHSTQGSTTCLSTLVFLRVNERTIIG